MDEHASPVNFGEYILSMNPNSGTEHNEILSELHRQVGDEAAGVDIENRSGPLGHYNSHMGSGVYAQIAIKIHGDDLDTLQHMAEQVKATIQDVPGHHATYCRANS